MSDTTRRTYSTSNNEEDEYSFSEEDSLLDGAHGPKERSRVTHRQFYSYRLHERDDGFNAPLHCGKLTQQIAVSVFRNAISVKDLTKNADLSQILEK